MECLSTGNERVEKEVCTRLKFPHNAYGHRFNFGRSLTYTHVQPIAYFETAHDSLLVADRRAPVAQQFGGSGVGLY